MSLSLREFSTKDLVEELKKREGVEFCFVEPEWIYEVAVETDRPHPSGMKGLREHLSGGMHTGCNTGPAIVLVVTD